MSPLAIAGAVIVPLLVVAATVVYAALDHRRLVRRLDQEHQREIAWWDNWLKARRERRRPPMRTDYEE
jgi:hypothetical protein